MDWKLMLWLLLPCWFLQNVIHEAAHCVVPLLRGCRVRIWPWPVKRNFQWYFAYSEWSGAKIKGGDLYWTMLAPRLADIGGMILFGIGSVALGGFWRALCVVLACTSLVDYVHGRLGILRPHGYPNDAWEAVKARGMVDEDVLSLERKTKGLRIRAVATSVMWTIWTACFWLASAGILPR